MRYIATHTLQTKPRWLVPQTFLTRRRHLCEHSWKAIPILGIFIDFYAFPYSLQEISIEAIQTARWCSPMPIEPPVWATIRGRHMGCLLWVQSVLFVEVSSLHCYTHTMPYWSMLWHDLTESYSDITQVLDIILLYTYHVILEHAVTWPDCVIQWHHTGSGHCIAVYIPCHIGACCDRTWLRHTVTSHRFWTLHCCIHTMSYWSMLWQDLTESYSDITQVLDIALLYTYHVILEHAVTGPDWIIQWHHTGSGHCSAVYIPCHIGAWCDGTWLNHTVTSHRFWSLIQ